MLGQGLELNAAPSEACEEREGRSAVEGQSPSAPTPRPPHEVASFLVQLAKLGGRDFAGRAFDQRGQVLAGELADIDAPTLGRCLEEPLSRQLGTRWWTSALVLQL